MTVWLCFYELVKVTCSTLKFPPSTELPVSYSERKPVHLVHLLGFIGCAVGTAGLSTLDFLWKYCSAGRQLTEGQSFDQGLFLYRKKKSFYIVWLENRFIYGLMGRIFSFFITSEAKLDVLKQWWWPACQEFTWRSLPRSEFPFWLHRFIFENHHFNGVAELLEILGRWAAFSEPTWSSFTVATPNSQ